MDRYAAAKAFFATCIVAGVVGYARTLRESVSEAEPVSAPPEEHILFADLAPAFIDSALGAVRLQVERYGYYSRSLSNLPSDDPRKNRGGSTAILVFVESRCVDANRLMEAGERLSRAFREATGGTMLFELCGYNADERHPFARISAGTDHMAYERYHADVRDGREEPRGNPGYFKWSSPPNFHKAVRITRRLMRQVAPVAA